MLSSFTDSLEKFAAQYSHEILSCLVLTGLALLVVVGIELFTSVRKDFKVTTEEKSND